MTINFDVVIDTDDYSVDMKAGLESLGGVSDAVRCVAESLLAEKVVKKNSHKGGVRTSLKKTFEGSYGIIFSLDIYDEGFEKKYKKIGKAAFIELISYFINEALYEDSNRLSVSAEKVLDKIGETAEDIVSQLRVSSLLNVHKVTKQFNHEVKVRNRVSRGVQTVIAKFDHDTAAKLEVKSAAVIVDLTVSITRLNIYTGNGRLQIKDQEETVAFGFGTRYRDVAVAGKKLFSENLSHNNGMKSEAWDFLEIRASSLVLNDGKVVKYIVQGF
jgi:ElaB/YqjD/DUF883 family membrane-anchored ribosome-binding protein